MPSPPIELQVTPDDHPAAKILKNESVLKSLSTPGDRFDRAGLLQELFAALGAREKNGNGLQALAKIMVAELYAGKEGGVARQRLLDSICRLINWHSDDVHAIPVEEMTEEELIASIDAVMPKLRLVAEAPPPKTRKPRKKKETPEATEAPEAPEAPRAPIGRPSESIFFDASNRPASIDSLDFTGLGFSEPDPEEEETRELYDKPVESES